MENYLMPRIKFAPPVMPQPPLLAACKSGQLEGVKLLLEYKDIEVNFVHMRMTPLSAAAKNGNIEIIRLLIENGAHVDYVGDSNSPEHVQATSALCQAALKNQFQAAVFLLKNGASVHSYTFHCYSPLMAAAEQGNTRLLNLLLEHSAGTHHKHYSLPLILSCEGGHTECAQLLIQHSADVNDNPGHQKYTPLMTAIKKGHKECTKLLLDNGADVNKSNENGETPLMLASRCGNTDTVQLLLYYGADVNISSDTTGGDTALSLACDRNNVQLAHVLIENGADVNHVTNDGPILLRVVHSYQEAASYNVTMLLLQNGAETNVTDSEGYYTPLMCVVQQGHLKITEELINHGATVDVQVLSTALQVKNRNSILKVLLHHASQVVIEDETVGSFLLKAVRESDYELAKLLLCYKTKIDIVYKHTTALIQAAVLGREKFVELLLDHGAQINLQNSNGDTALMVASQRGHTKCIEQLLLQKDIDVNQQNNKKCTALMIASEKGHVTIMESLLKHGAKLDMLDIQGYSAMFYAVKSNSLDAVKMLVNNGADIRQRSLDEKTILQFAYKCHSEPNRHIIQMLRARLFQDQDDKPTLRDVFLLFVPIADEWQSIGELLKVPKEDLVAIEADNALPRHCLRKMLSNWLTLVDNCITWTALAEAVEPTFPSKALEIRQEYCREESNEASPACDTQKPIVDQYSEEQDTGENMYTNSLEEGEDENVTENTDDSREGIHLAAVERAITEKGTLEHTLSHGAMVGPARSGKSSLMSRLAGEMPSSTLPSTGVAEKVVQVGVRKSYHVALGVHETIWFKLLYDQEAIRLMTLASHNIPSPSNQPATPLTDSTRVLPLPTEIQREPENTISPIMHTHKPVPTQAKSELPEGYIPPMEIFKGVIQGKGFETLRQHFENSWSFYLTDTGGQVEFQELIPLLVSGPSVFFFTFRLDQDLNQRFTIEYHLPDGGRSEPYQSTLTVVEAILQTLASVASMGIFTYKGPKMKHASLKPKMFIVGTHKDKLDPATADSEIKKIDQFLQDVVYSLNSRLDIVQFASKSQLIYTVNNFSEDDSDFMRIRSGVERVVCHSRFKVHFPTHWLIFSLVLRQEMIKDSIISYEQCFSIAQDCGITDTKEFNHALWFLHTKIGLIRHFPTPGLNHFVIRDPQILFDMVTKLIVNTFTFENVGKQCLTEFEKKGVFTLEDFLALHQESSPLLPPEKLLQLLEDLQIIATFEEDGQKKFFIPCVLAHSEESEFQSLPQSSDIPPLLITFKCGYCPKGLAGALIVYLLTNKMGSKFKWQLKTDQIFRNQVSFLVSSYDIITLKIHPTFLELIHSSARKITDSTKGVARSTCNKTRVYIENGVKQVSTAMYLSSNATVSFYCQNSVCNEKHPPHPATEIVKDEYGSVMLCKKSGEVEISNLPFGYSMWLPEVTTSGHKAPHGVESNTKPANTSEVSASYGPTRDDMKGADQYDPSTSKQFGLTKHSMPAANDSGTFSFHHETKPKVVLPATPHHTTTLGDDMDNQNASKSSKVDKTKVKVLTEKDHLKIVRFVRTLENADIILLGQALGLLRSKLKRLQPLPDEMVDAWLRQEDDVAETSGPPTWDSLAKALREIGQNGIASEIESLTKHK